MTTKEKLSAELKAAMIAKDTHKRDVIRLMQAAIKQVEVDGGETLNEEQVIAVLNKQAKQRRDSLAVYEQNDRPELAEVEAKELAVIENYLPQQMSRDEVTKIAQETIDSMGVSGMPAMGKVMGKLMGQLKGKADGGMISAVVKELLQNS